MINMSAIIRTGIS